MGRGAALRGMGKVLAKHLRKVPVLGKHVKKVRGTPTKAGLVARRAALRGDKPTKVKELDVGIKVGGIGGAGIGTVIGYALGKSKAKKEAKEKETKGKLKKSVEEHKKKTKEQKEKAKG